MQAQAIFSESAISELFCQAWKAGCISSEDCQQLISAAVEIPLCEEEQAALKRLSHAIRRGWLEVVD